jgi:hypothetical protein
MILETKVKKLMSKTKTDRPPTRLSRRPNFSKLGLIVFAVIFSGVGAYVLLSSKAAPPAPTVYLSAASGVFGTNTSFSVQIRENSGTTAVNAVQANLSFPASLLSLVSIDYTGTAFGTQAQSTSGTSTINIARGTSCNTTCGTLTGDQLVATLNFKTLTTGGSAAVAFTAGTALVESTNNTNLITNVASMTGSGSYTIDTTPPTVSITAPANNATLAAGSNVNVTVNASDSASSVAKVEYYVDGSLSGTVSTSPFTYVWNTTGLALGAHTVQAKAYDTFNNTASSSTINVTLADQTAPSAPTNFKAASSTPTSINLSWTASTDNIGVVSYKIKRGGTLIATVTAPTTTYNDTGLTANTAYSYTIQAFDAANNGSSITSLNVSTPTITPGDLNQDGHVNVTDLSILLSNYATTNATGDINNDGNVDILDLSILLSHYGS